MPKKRPVHHAFSKKKNPQTRLAIIVLTIVISVFLLGQAVRFIDSLFDPLTPYAGVADFKWDSKTNLNLVIKGKDISLVSLDQNAKTIQVVDVPTETYIQVPGGYGTWRLGSVYDLGESDKKGGWLLIRTVSNLFGLPVEGIIELKNPNENSGHDFIEKLRTNPFSVLGSFSKINSSLNKVDLLKLAKSISSVRFDKVSNLNLENFDVLKAKTLSDNTDVLVAEPSVLDSFVIDKLAESKIKEEQLTIAIFNATDVPGLAQKAARIIANMGGNVIISTNAPIEGEMPNVDKTYLFSADSTNSYTYKRLGEYFAPGYDKIKNLQSKLEEIKNTSRAQINIVLGMDFVDRY